MNFPFTPANSSPNILLPFLWHSPRMSQLRQEDCVVLSLCSPQAFIWVLVHITCTPSGSSVLRGEVQAIGTQVARNPPFHHFLCTVGDGSMVSMCFFKVWNFCLCFSHPKALASSIEGRDPPCGLLFCFALISLQYEKSLCFVIHTGAIFKSKTIKHFQITLLRLYESGWSYQKTVTAFVWLCFFTSAKSRTVLKVIFIPWEIA